MTCDEKEYIKFIKNTIKKSFFEDEKEDYKNGLKVLGVSQNTYLLSAIPIRHNDNDLPEIDIINIPQTKFSKIISKKMLNASEDDIEAINRFNIVCLRLHFIIMEYIRIDGGVINALEYAKFLLYNLNKTEGRLTGENQLSDFFIPYRNNLERAISKFNDDLKKNTVIKPKLDKVLEWKGTSKNLKEISKELKIKGFTKNPTDFEKVFTEHIPTDWLRDPEYLAYLLHKLSSPPLLQFTSPKGGKYKVAQTLFYDNRKGYRNNFNLSNLIYNVNKRQATKHRKTRDRVNNLVSQFIK